MTAIPVPEAAPAAVPEHSHLGNYTAVAGCSRCASLGAINPDTLTPWPSLDEHGEQVLSETADRFADRYDGDNHTAALEAALAEAYLRGVMHGRLEEAREATRRAQQCERDAEEHIKRASERLGSPEELAWAARSLADAQQLLTFARGLRSAAGQRGSL